MVRSPDPPPWHERYNRTNTMFASAGSLLGWRTARPAPQPSRRTLLIAVVVAGLGLSVPGANAVARNDPSILSAPGAAEDAAVQAEATQLRARYHADPAALLASAQAALAAGRNDATIAYFLERGWADRLNAALERYGAMLGTADLSTEALADAGIQRYATQLRASLIKSGPTRLITISLQAQRLIAYDRGRVVVDTLVTGSQNGPFASHGCVHLPLAAVTTLFQWAPIGTPVVVVPGDGAPAVTQVAQRTVDPEGNPLTGVRGD